MKPVYLPSGWVLQPNVSGRGLTVLSVGATSPKAVSWKAYPPNGDAGLGPFATKAEAREAAERAAR